MPQYKYIQLQIQLIDVNIIQSNMLTLINSSWEFD